MKYLAVVGAVLIIDLIALGWQQSSLARLAAWRRSARTDLVVALLHWLRWAQVPGIIAAGGLVWLAKQLVAPLELGPGIQGLMPGWLQFVVVFVVTDFMHYWFHRVSHQVTFLWEAHKYHHAATEFTILTGNRVHVLEEALQRAIVAIPIALLGGSVATYVGVRGAITAFDLLQHSMVPWTYGWFGRWVVFSPVGHRIHHSKEMEHWDRNFGDILVIWDRLFGTWYGGNRVNAAVDVSDNDYNRRGVVTEYLQCGWLYGRAFAESFRSGEWVTKYHRSHRLRGSMAQKPLFGALLARRFD